MVVVTGRVSCRGLGRTETSICYPLKKSCSCRVRRGREKTLGKGQKDNGEEVLRTPSESYGEGPLGRTSRDRSGDLTPLLEGVVTGARPGPDSDAKWCDT